MASLTICFSTLTNFLPPGFKITEIVSAAVDSSFMDWSLEPLTGGLPGAAAANTTITQGGVNYLSFLADANEKAGEGTAHKSLAILSTDKFAATNIVYPMTMSGKD